MLISWPIRLVKEFKRFWISVFILLFTVGCINTTQYYFYSHHLPDKQKAAFLHELVYSLHLNTNSQLLYRLYGNLQYSLTPIDLDYELNGQCKMIKRSRSGRAIGNGDVNFYNFFSDVFDEQIMIASRKQSDCGYEAYLDDFWENDKLDEAVHLALIRFQDIAERLESLHFNKQSLLAKYDDIDELTAAIDQDIKSLSKAGYKLGQSTKRFFVLAKTQMVMKDIADIRSEGLKNLKTFASKIEQVKQAQYKTIEEATLATIEVLEQLEQDINN